MNLQDGKELYLRINTRYNRFSIYKQTLEYIGNPDFIHLGFHPKSGRLMVLGAWTDEKKAIRVHFDNRGSFYFYSKSLINGIREINGSLREEGSYLLKGMLVESMPAICFSVREAQTDADDEK